MLLEDLISDFEKVKDRQPTNENELLDYVKYCYIFQKISSLEFRNLFHELHLRGATVPDYVLDDEKKQAQVVS